MWREVIYLRPGGRRPVRLTPYRVGEDLQASVPVFWCAVCGREVYALGQVRCSQCRKGEIGDGKVT